MRERPFSVAGNLRLSGTSPEALFEGEAILGSRVPNNPRREAGGLSNLQPPNSLGLPWGCLRFLCNLGGLATIANPPGLPWGSLGFHTKEVHGNGYVSKTRDLEVFDLKIESREANVR